ncbi:hypothetical protein LOD99_9284 [Oopsacas minuta]|uniref:Uncharacterized protein n=1 Tax=Oopsacas minuta TaxID=111878 RepID=A0AAV7JC80_9METZ|nr:hypothetical protein LOD99_9284 [Oopsacas minuta]
MGNGNSHVKSKKQGNLSDNIEGQNHLTRAEMEHVGSGLERVVKIEEELEKQIIENAFLKGVQLDKESQKYLADKLKEYYSTPLHPLYGSQQITAFAVGALTAQFGLNIDQDLLADLLTDVGTTVIQLAIRMFLQPQQYAVFPITLGQLINQNQNQNLLSPDLTMKHMVSQSTRPLEYTLYICASRITTGVKLLYHCRVVGEDYITSPYFVEDKNVGEIVPCADPINITEHLRRPNPIPAIRRALRSLESSNSGMDNGFYFDDFSWKRVGSVGNFSLQSPRRSSSSSQFLYWMGEARNPEVSFTENRSRELQLGITES